MDLAVLLGLLVSQVGEVAGDGVVGLSRLPNEVQGIMENWPEAPVWRNRILYPWGRSSAGAASPGSPQRSG